MGPIDVWINNAMATVFAPVVQTTAEEYRRVTESDVPRLCPWHPGRTAKDAPAR